MRLSLLCEKPEAILLVLVGLTAGSLGGQHAVRRNTGRFENSLWIALVATYYDTCVMTSYSYHM